MSYFPGYDIHNKLPYAEHFNFSIQRELSKSTVLTLSYVGTEGHRLIAQTEANPGDPALCKQLTAQGGNCGPNAEQNTFTVGGNTIYGTRDTLLNPNYCPGAGSLCFGYGNTFTKLVANSDYHSGEVTVEGKAGDVTFLASYTLAKAIDDSSAFGELINFPNAKLSRGLSSVGRSPELCGQLYLGDAVQSDFPRLAQAYERMAIAGHYPICDGISDPDG